LPTARGTPPATQNAGSPLPLSAPGVARTRAAAASTSGGSGRYDHDGDGLVAATEWRPKRSGDPDNDTKYGGSAGDTVDGGTNDGSLYDQAENESLFGGYGQTPHRPAAWTCPTSPPPKPMSWRKGWRRC
jgi:hypothetical protein